MKNFRLANRNLKYYTTPIPAVLLLFFYGVTVQAQALITDSPWAVLQNKDSARCITSKRPWRGAGELLVSELIPWSYNYFIRDADFAKISFQSIGHNLKLSSWEWDDNNFKTNQFGHPYQGNLFYSSFRSNGYDFWHAAPAAFAGSLLWEIAGETHNPAPNDFINTSLGGVSLGEMTYRLSKAIVNNHKRGFGRQVQEVFAFVVNPLNGLNRIVDGKWGRVYHCAGDSISIPISAMLDAGGRLYSERNNGLFTKGKSEFFMRLRLDYGDAGNAISIPFSNFSIVAEVGASDSATLNVLTVNGVLHQWIIKDENYKKQRSAITMNYDYYNNSSFLYGGQSFYYRYMTEWSKPNATKIKTMLGAGVIVLAAVPDDYLYYGEGRNYDYGPGISITAAAGYDFGEKISANFNYRGGLFKTLNGNTSSFLLNTASAELRYRFSHRFSLAMELGRFSLNGWYANYPDVDKRYPYIRYSMGYRLFDK